MLRAYMQAPLCARAQAPRAVSRLHLGAARRTSVRPVCALDPSGTIHISETVILFGSAAASVGLPLAFAKRNRVQDIAPKQLLSQGGKSVLLLDVRTVEQRCRQGLPNPPEGVIMLHAPWLRQANNGYCKRNPHYEDDVMFAAHGVAPGTTMVIMDMEGEVSNQAATVASQLLDKCTVVKLAGGFEAWKAAGLPVAASQGCAGIMDAETGDLLCELEAEPATEPIFRPKMLDVMASGYSLQDLKQDVLSGLVVGIIALSLSMALGIASESTPAIGVVTAVVSGFLISLLGGSRVCVGGPTAAFIPIVVGVAHQYGVENLVVCTGLAGAFLVAMGASGLGTAIKLIPKPVVTGFTAGIATYIFSTQIKDFLGLGTPGAMPEGAVVPSEFLEKLYFFANHMDHVHMPSLALALACFGITLKWPKPWAKVAPPQIVAVAAGTLGLLAADAAFGGSASSVASDHVAAVAAAGPFGIETIGSHYGVDAIPSSLPMPHIPDGLTNPATIAPLIQPAISIAMLAAIESLLCARVSDTMIGDKHNPNTELIAQGFANIASAAFGGLPATGALARTAANVRAGGRSPIAGCVHAATILTVMMTAAPMAAYIPLPALSAVLVMVAINMGEWRHFRQLASWPEKDAQLFLLAFFLTVLQDVTVAVELGMAAAVLLYVRDVNSSLQVKAHQEGDLLTINPLPPSQAAALLSNNPGGTTSNRGTRNGHSVSPAPAALLATGTWAWGDSYDSDAEDFSGAMGASMTAPLQVPASVSYLDITGSLLFGGGLQLEQAVSSLLSTSGDKPKVLMLGMSHLATCDVSGLEVLEDILHMLRKAGVGLVLVGPTQQPLKMLARAGFLQEVGRQNVCRSLGSALNRAVALAEEMPGPNVAKTVVSGQPTANNIIGAPVRRNRESTIDIRNSSAASSKKQ